MENQKDLEDKLWKIFGNVNDWLKVAEAKNAMLIGFNGASIFGISRIMENCSITVKWYFYMVCSFLLISLIISLISFVPRLIDLPFSKYSKSNSGNIFFFEHLKTLNSQELLKAHFKKADDEEFPDLLKNLANQIISNSKIASLKYSYFMVAIWFTIFGILTPFFGGLLFGYWYAQQVKL